MKIWRRLVMGVLVICAFSIYSPACGTERWAVKTLRDRAVGTIDRTAKSATVSELGQLTAPSQSNLIHSGQKRFGPVELTTYRIDAVLLGYRHEADEDLHLVLANPDNPHDTMIAEIPATDCVGNQALGVAPQKMRDELIGRFGAPGVHTKRLAHPVRVTIRGIGFFDIKHSTPQDGVAPNGIELHPVLGLSLPAS
jgi:hypothetical protein